MSDKSSDFEYFPEVPIIPYAPGSTNTLAFRHYDPRELLDLGGDSPSDLWCKIDHAVAIWHVKGGSSGDPFGPPTHIRPWTHISDWKEQSRVQAKAVFSLWERVRGGYKTHCFHDFDWVQEAPTLRESEDRLKFVVDLLNEEQRRTGIKLLWGTPCLFVHPRWANGSTNSADRAIWERALAQAKIALWCTKELGGKAFVLWGGRVGYTDLLARAIKKDRMLMRRFLEALIEYKHHIGFKGPIFIEPKAKEPTNHQYDFDAATVIEFLEWCKIGPEEVMLNLEEGHAELAQHTFYHEMEVARAAGRLGSLDINQGTPGVGWDTDEYLHSVDIATHIGLAIIRNNGLVGGCNVDAKPRRACPDILSWVKGHILSLDTLTRGVRAAAWLIKDGRYQKLVDQSYSSWDDEAGKAILAGTFDQEAITARSMDLDIAAAPSAQIEEIWALFQQAQEHANSPVAFAEN